MKYYVSCSIDRTGNGTLEKPFRTIGEAADIAEAGDEVIVMPGVYREYVDPKYSGKKNARIIYRSYEKGKAIISGAEPIKDWEKFNGNVWRTQISNQRFGKYNPYTVLVEGDWNYNFIPIHTGEVYLNGKSMYETDRIEDVLNPEIYNASWTPQESVYKWYTEQKDDNTVIYANFQGVNPNEQNVEINVRRNCFFPDRTGINYITVTGFVLKQAATTWAPPTAYQDGLIGPHWSKGWIIEDCEISDSKCCGISLGKYLQPENENKWSHKRLKTGAQTEREVVCQAVNEGWSEEKVGSHIIRNCEIHDCEQAGIAGHMGGVFSLIENNHIHHINNKQQIQGGEIAGIKIHAAIDTILRKNHIHHCTRGMWLDWQAQGSRVTQNLFHDNLIPETSDIMAPLAVGEDLFVEVSHGPTLIDNNIFLTTYAAKLATQGCAFVHNLICGAFTSVGWGTDNHNNSPTGLGPRYTPYHVPHSTQIAGFMSILHGDDRFYNNIFIQNSAPKKISDYWIGAYHEMNNIAGTGAFVGYPTAKEYFAQFFNAEDVGRRESRSKYYTKLPVYTGGNAFFNGAKPNEHEENYREVEERIRISLKEDNGKYYLETNLFEYMPEFETKMITTETLGEAFEPEQRFENSDGTDLTIDFDYFGNKRGRNPKTGAFETKQNGCIRVL